MTEQTRLPVIIGVSQIQQRVSSPSEVQRAREPLELMVEATLNAAKDAATPTLLGTLDLIAVVRGAWNYSDPGRILAQRVGAHNARTALTPQGGNAPLSALHEICRKVVDGEIRAALLAGGEGVYSRRQARQLGIEIPYTKQRDAAPNELIGRELAMTTKFEDELGLRSPVTFYALIETAVRHAKEMTVGEHKKYLGQIWQRYNEVAVANPDSWSHQCLSAEEISEVTEQNAMISYPYTKRMCSNWFTDQAAALLITSDDLATALGVPADRRVYPYAIAETADTQFVSNRRDLHSSRVMARAFEEALSLAAVGLEEIAHLDIYSCFASSVQIAHEVLGLDVSNPRTLTGGMPYFGGPVNNYVSHALVSVVERVRDEPGTLGMVTANGGFLTKHGAAVFGTDEPISGFQSARHAPDVPSRQAADRYEGRASVEAYTVSREPALLCACLTPDGRRTWGLSSARETCQLAQVEDLVGRTVSISTGGHLRLDAA